MTRLIAHVLAAFLVLGAGAVAAGSKERPHVTVDPDDKIDPDEVVGPASDLYDTPPKLISGKSPIYPIRKKLSGQGGSADITYTIGANGKPTDFNVERTDNESYSNHAIIAVREWTFAPALKAGQPVAVRVQQIFEFNVK